MSQYGAEHVLICYRTSVHDPLNKGGSDNSRQGQMKGGAKARATKGLMCLKTGPAKLGLNWNSVCRDLHKITIIMD